MDVTSKAPPASSSQEAIRAWGYRPALDGLRAVAVVGVLLYHGGVEWAQGGFLGVDLFFALSGYLITTLLVIERREVGHIDRRAFWARRARRLLPALFLLLAAVAVYVAFSATPEEADRLRGDGLASLLYVGNWWYVIGGASYFEAFKPSMFRHTWSLAIEEQFYLVWPIALAAAYRWLGTEARRLALVVLSAAIASAVLMSVLYNPDADPSRVFYGTDTRAQALLVGAAFALAFDTWGHRVSERIVGTGGTICLGGCFAMFALADARSSWLYEGGFFVMALLATGAIAAAANCPRAIVTRLLSRQPLVWIGTISYGLYLWHWPIFIFLDENRTGLSGSTLLLERLIATLAIAAMSFYLFEAPIRRSSLRWSPLSGALLIGLTALLAVLLVTSTSLVGRISTPLDSATPTDPSALRILVTGDSTAFSLAVNYGGTGGLRVQTAAILGCGVVRGSNQPIDRPPFGTTTKCDAWPDRWRAAEQSFSPDVTLVGIGAWEVFNKTVDGRLLVVGTDAWRTFVRSELELTLQIASERHKRVLYLNVPCYRSINSLQGPPSPERNDPGRVAAVNAVLDAFVNEHRDVAKLLDLRSLLCPDGSYQDEVNGVQTRDDGVHFTAEGAALVWAWLLPQLTI